MHQLCFTMLCGERSLDSAGLHVSCAEGCFRKEDSAYHPAYPDVLWLAWLAVDTVSLSFLSPAVILSGTSGPPASMCHSWRRLCLQQTGASLSLGVKLAVLSSSTQRTFARPGPRICHILALVVLIVRQAACNMEALQTHCCLQRTLDCSPSQLPRAAGGCR